MCRVKLWADENRTNGFGKELLTVHASPRRLT